MFLFIASYKVKSKVTECPGYIESSITGPKNGRSKFWILVAL